MGLGFLAASRQEPQAHFPFLPFPNYNQHYQESNFLSLAKDRTELHDLAAAEPERLQAMIKTWTDMARDNLHAPPKSLTPVDAAKLPHSHPEWTRFDHAEPEAGAASRQRRTGSSPTTIKARKNTQMEIVDGQLQLKFTGDDPGIAMDLSGRELPAGPYRLTFQLMGGGKDVWRGVLYD